MDLPGELEDVEILSQRLDFLTFLTDNAADKATIVEELDHSRSTVDRAINTLEDAGFVEKTAEGFVTTLTGRLAVERYEQFLDETETVLGAESVLRSVPLELDLPESLVLAGEVRTDVDGDRLPEDCRAAIETATTCRALVPKAAPREPIAAALRDTGEATIVVTPGSGEVWESGDSVTVLEAEVPTVGLVVLESGGDRSVWLLGFDDGSLVGTITASAPDAVEWAESLLDDIEADGTGR